MCPEYTQMLTARSNQMDVEICLVGNQLEQTLIYRRDPDHFEDFGLVTDQRCSTKPGTVLCVVDNEDALFSSVQSTATFPSGATSSVQSQATFPSGATVAQTAGSSLFE